MEQPRRKRQRTPMEAFKQDRLPLIIAAVAVILIVVFIIGSISLAVEKNKAKKRLARQETAKKEQHALWDSQQHQVAAQADALMAQMDYEGALSVLESFEGDPATYTEVGDRLTKCRDIVDSMVEWNDPGKVVNLSFQLLIADTGRAFTCGNSDLINRNFVTVEEFGKILQQMYENGYVLVDRHDFMEVKTEENGAVVYAAKTLKLPEGKKPFMLTETNVNYNYYLVDRNEDGTPDSTEGAGFAARLLVDEEGKFVNELMTKDGKLVRGDYDMVPILEKFIATHPGFSYKGARATIALTGNEGLFGYRDITGADQAQAKKVADALKAAGYTLACYSYGNKDYSYNTVATIREEITYWQQRVEPVIGKVDTFVFAQGKDIGGSGAYQGEKFQALYDAGFRYFVGFCNDGAPWAGTYGDYFRQGRILVNAPNMKNHAQWFSAMFDTELVLDAARPYMYG